MFFVTVDAAAHGHAPLVSNRTRLIGKELTILRGNNRTPNHLADLGTRHINKSTSRNKTVEATQVSFILDSH